MMCRLLTTWLIGLFCVLAVLPPALAQQAAPPAVAEQPEPPVSPDPLVESIERLTRLQASMNDVRAELRRLERTNTRGDSVAEAERKTKVDALTEELAGLRRSFEQIAAGGVEFSALRTEPATFDWRQELVMVTQPLLEALKALTEKPRRIEQLRARLATLDDQNELIGEALAALDRRLAADPPRAVAEALRQIRERWQLEHEANRRAVESANLQIAALRGDDRTLAESIGDALSDFFKGRGLTLLIAAGVTALVVMLTGAVRRTADRRLKLRDVNATQKTRYRLLAYGYRLLTVLLTAFAVMMVFYLRDDVLLLALSVIIFIGIVLALRNNLPRYLSETRLLLNLGQVREGERVMYNGLPWLVRSINVYSVLKNPLLDGVVRLPLSALNDLVSRPVRDENWFPTRVGDLVLTADNLLAEVMRQTPEMVTLKLRGGMLQQVVSADFFAGGMLNLTQGGSYSVVATFGIDYGHQDICLDKVAPAFHAAIDAAFVAEGLREQVNEIIVDLSAAGASSLDYVLVANLRSEAASSYFKVGRILQQACIATCNREGWGIPFPQLTVHLPDGAAASSTSAG